MRKKVIIISVIVAVIVVGWIAYVVLSARQGTPPQTSGGSLPSSVTTATTTGSGEVVVSSTPPAGTTLQIGTPQGTVTTKNFYTTAAYITQDQETVVLSESDAYTIDYDRNSSSFVIALLSLSGTTLDALRTTAEQAFLAQLGISKSDACKLAVDERVLDKTSAYDGELMGLSFCASGISQ